MGPWLAELTDAILVYPGGPILILIGPPGSGKSMMARRLPTILI